jgi:hypothetical protein
MTARIIPFNCLSVNQQQEPDRGFTKLPLEYIAILSDNCKEPIKALLMGKGI